MFRFKSSAVFFGALILAVAACGSDDPKSDSSTPVSSDPVSTEATVTSESTSSSSGAADPSATFSVDAANGTVTLDAKPVRIVSLAPSQTETLYAIGAGPQVVAVDDQSNYPPESAAVKSTLSGLTPNVEAIAGYEPDLVVVADDFTGLIPQLEALGIPVWSGPAATSFDDAYTQIEQLGVLTGNVGAAAEVVANMQSDIDTILKEVPESEVPLTYYHELDNTLFSVTSETFIGQIYSLAGLRNIADGAEAGNNYPQLNTEFIVTANPDLIFLADTKCCGESGATVAARDGWADIAAVKNGNVIELDDDIASRWGPRLVDYLRTVVDAVNAVAATPATTG